LILPVYLHPEVVVAVQIFTLDSAERPKAPFLTAVHPGRYPFGRYIGIVIIMRYGKMTLFFFG
jgi:hypothetical protein